MTAFIGVDPGQTGAIAVISDNGVMVWDWPGDETAAAKIAMDLWTHSPKAKMAAIESQNAFPGQGVTSMFKLGKNFGTWLGILAMLGVPYKIVRAQEWQKGVVTKSAGKDGNLAAARRLFPEAELHLKKHHGRADALLIAYWAKCNSR